MKMTIDNRRKFMEVYLDNSATTKVDERIIEELNNTFKYFGNPSSLHAMGFDSEKLIAKAKGTISDYLNCSKNEIYFTSGGTEANNLAIIGYSTKNSGRGKHLITSKTEHKSVINAYKYLETQGFEITYLDVDDQGFIALEQLQQAITDETILVSIMHVNNEIGTIQDFQKIKKILKEKNPSTALHVDGVQGFGKIALDLKGIDLYSFSAHKIHGLKGIGGLYIQKGTNINNLLHGGQQEKGIRPGTENLTGIISLGKAIEIYRKNDYYSQVAKIKQKITDLITHEIEDVKINSASNHCSPYILNVAFNGVRGEVLLHDLESKGIYVSTGSACNSKSKAYSHVLNAIGLPDHLKEGSIRISFSKDNTMDEVHHVVNEIKKSVEFIRDVMKGR
jgi:cysteine desulfurase